MSQCCLVFIHLGPVIPDHARDALKQARLFNSCSIYMVGAASALQVFPMDPLLEIQTVACESLPQSDAHFNFQRRSTLDRDFRGGFWTFTTERFFYLESLMRALGLEHVFHLENDVMLYVDLDDLLPIFVKHYLHTGGTFDNDQRCIPGFLYLRSARDAASLTEFIAGEFEFPPEQTVNDMTLLAAYRQRCGPVEFNSLPIVPRDYPRALVSRAGHFTSQAARYSQHAELFDSLFDAAALGQYLGGIDPRNSPDKDTIGFINESSLFDPSVFTYTFQPDPLGRLIPFLHTSQRTYRLNNLHIHSKDLQRFRSA